MGVKVIGVAQLREELATILGELSKFDEVVVTQRGEGRAILLELDRYNSLLERLEYLEDSLDAHEVSREGSVEIGDLA